MSKMETQIYNADKQILQQAAELLKAGEVVGFPTETVYGLGANAINAAAVKKIFEAKGRPQDNPLIVHIANKQDLFRYGKDISNKAVALADRFWPGPLTLVVKSADVIASEVTCGLDTVGIRCPENEIARELIRLSDLLIAAPSANRSGRPSPTTAQHVFEDMNGRIPMIVDGGACRVGVESTVISMVADIPIILRPGIISREDVEAVIGPVDLSPSIDAQLSDDSKVQSPGMKYRHYAPLCPLHIISGKQDAVISYINSHATSRTGILCFSGEESAFPVGKVLSLGSEGDAYSLSQHLFSVLREFDEAGVEMIYARLCRNDGEFLGVYNRLLKASGFTRIDV
jgi:L-threonylcarbamoyladenylate synthase